MPVPASYAVLQREVARPTAEQIRRAFRSFSHLTDADAVRLAANAQGILMRQLSADAARAFLRALQAEGVPAAIVAESELQLLPPSKALHRLALTETALAIYDLRGQPLPVTWRKLALVAAGAVQNEERSHSRSDPPAMSFQARSGIWPKRGMESGRKVATNSQLMLEIVLTGGTTRYAILADEFPFKYALDCPGLSTLQKFVWLVREISQRAPGAILNRGARDVQEGIELVRGYPNRQVFNDEMTWLLWNAAQPNRTTPAW